MLRLIAIVLVAGVLMQSCKEDCTCYQVCSYFNNDSVKVCNWSYNSDVLFKNVKDSLTSLYPHTERDTLLNPNDLGRNTFNSNSYRDKLNQHLREGEFCSCPK